MQQLLRLFPFRCSVSLTSSRYLMCFKLKFSFLVSKHNYSQKLVPEQTCYNELLRAHKSDNGKICADAEISRASSASYFRSTAFTHSLLQLIKLESQARTRPNLGWCTRQKELRRHCGASLERFTSHSFTRKRTATSRLGFEISPLQVMN